MGLPEEYINMKPENEEDFKKNYINELKKYFEIREEWWGTHFTGKRMRIDAVMRPKDYSEWANKKIFFGVEFKSPTKLDSFGKQSKVVKQIIDYSNTNFDGLGHIPILICPGIFFYEDYSNEDSNQFIRKFLNMFNIGELKNTYRGLSIVFSEKHFIWTSKFGIGEGKKNKLITKFGSQ